MNNNQDGDLERPLDVTQYGAQEGSAEGSPERDPLLYSFGRDDLNASTESDPLIGHRSKKGMSYVKQEESVYSAILFLPGISRLKTGKETNKSARLALLLVLLNAVLQLGVVQVIDQYAYITQRRQTQKLLHPSDVADWSNEQEKQASKVASDAQDDAHEAVLLPNEKKELRAARNIPPLCHRAGDGKLECVPHSVLFVHEWKNLDTNGDGVWTLEEAQADAAGLKKKFHGLKPETIFYNVINGLRMSRNHEEKRGMNRTLYLSSDVDNDRAIPKAYFNFWSGDAMMCSLFESTTCEAGAKAGIFKEALRPGRISADAKGIHDLDSAIQYCYRMLQPGGGCETALPVNFKQNREQRLGMCGKGQLVEGGKYTNPFEPDQYVRVLTTSYDRVDQYQRATSRLYLIFQCLIIMLWFLALTDEFQTLIRFGEFLIAFPGIQPGTAGGEIIEKDGQEARFRITGLTKKHRAVLAAVWLIRVLVICVLTNFGTLFLLFESNYLSLVLNSLALTFVLTIDSMLFSLVEKHTVDELKTSKKLGYKTRLPTDGFFGYILKKECWGLFLVPILSVCLVLYVNYRDKEPILTALRCACNQEGAKCLDSAMNHNHWWDHYWSHVLPAAVHQVEAMRLANA